MIEIVKYQMQRLEGRDAPQHKIIYTIVKRLFLKVSCFFSTTNKRT